MQKVSSEFSTSWWTERVALYGSTTVSETFGDGTTEKVAIMRSGNSSRILLIKSVPMPAPVPPPREWVIWKPWRQSHPSASRRTTSSHLINKFRTLGVVTFGPVVASTGLAKDEIVGTEELTERAGADSIHRTGLEINQDGTRHILVSRSLSWVSGVVLALFSQGRC